MNRTVRIVAGLMLVIALLAGLSVMTVSAQGPTGTATPTATLSPAQAPPAGAAGPNLDDPTRAATLGSAVQSIPANGVQWYRFDYNTNGNTFPRPQLMIRMLNGVANGLGFEVWSPERMQPNWFDNVPVGRGTQEVIAGCTITNDDGTTKRCMSNDLTWVGGFGVDGPYFVRVINNTKSSVTPQIIISGTGLTQCANTPQTQTSGNQPFILALCQNPTPDQLAAMSQGTTANAPSQPAAAPTVSASPTAAATSAPTTAATTAPTVGATSAPTTAATSAATSVAPTTSAGAPPAATSAAGATSPATSTAGLAVATDPKLGQYLTDNLGRALYAFVKDTNNTSTCTGTCAQTWPAFSVPSGTPKAGSGVTASMIGTAGSGQVSYNGHPLYYFASDNAAGDTKGQGVGGNWFLVSPSGELIKSGGASGATTPSASPTP